MDEQRPAARTNKPLNRHAAPVRTQLISTLTVAHLIHDAAPVELRAAFAEAEQRRVPGEEMHGAVRVDSQILGDRSPRAGYPDADRRGRGGDGQVAEPDRPARPDGFFLRLEI